MSSGLASAIGAILLVASACNSTGDPLPDLAAEINASYEAHRMGILAGDVLVIKFTDQADWNHETQVRPDGSASFLHLGDLKVGMLSIEALDKMLTAAYSQTIRQYELTVFVRQAGGTYAVVGAVGTPDVFSMPGGRLTLLEALAKAGGVSELSGNLKDIQLVRWSPTEGRQLKFHIDARTKYWADADPVLLQPYDLVYVPLKTIVHVDSWVDKYIRQLIPFPYLIPPIY